MTPRGPGRWVTRTVAGIVLATFLSDFSHEMCTAVLPLYLANVGLGAAALGAIEGVADFLVSLSKLGGGILGHRVERKRPWTSFGYLVTSIATAAIGLAQSAGALVVLRSVAWIGRGFRGPLRDFLLADAVEPTHYGRAFGLERAGDMLGAVTGPLVATLLLALGVDLRTVILWTVVPGVAAAGAMFFMTRERAPAARPAAAAAKTARRPGFPRAFWLFLVGVTLFGLGDFSRTFLIWLVAHRLGEGGASAGGAISIAALLYAGHNLVSAAAAFPAGRLGDRGSKLRVLIAGYGLGVVTNLVLAGLGGSFAWLVAAFALSGVYIAVEETLEKAVASELLPRELRSLGLGVLACANAVGDMASSLGVGWLLEQGKPGAAFGIAAACGALGVTWLSWLAWRARRRTT